MHLSVLYYQYMDLLSQVFLIFNYWNFGIGMFVLRSSFLVQVTKKIFGKTNKRGGPNKHRGVEGMGSGKFRGNIFWHSKYLNLKYLCICVEWLISDPLIFAIWEISIPWHFTSDLTNSCTFTFKQSFRQVVGRFDFI